MDGQLAALRMLAQKQLRPKSGHVLPGQLALDLLGFMLAQRQREAGGSAMRAAPAAPKAAPREKRTGKLHLVPVASVRSFLSPIARDDMLRSQPAASAYYSQGARGRMPHAADRATMAKWSRGCGCGED